MTRFGAYVTSDDVTVPELTTSGPPASGAHLVGDTAVDEAGAMWFCTTAGTPGTWSPQIGARVFYDEKTDNQAVAAGVTADLANLDSATFTVETGQVYLVELDLPFCTVTAGGTASGIIADASNNIKRLKSLNATTSSLTVREVVTEVGSITRKGRGAATTQGVTFAAGATFPITLMVTRIQ